jgi:hypothetical protein
MLHSQACEVLIFRIKMRTRNEGNCGSSSFPKSVARMQRADAALVYAEPAPVDAMMLGQIMLDSAGRARKHAKKFR